MDFFNDKTRRLQECSLYYLEELASAYRYSEVLLTALELGVFTHLNPDGNLVEGLADELGMETDAATRFLHVLETLGLVCFWQGNYCNSKISRRYLVRGNIEYQGCPVVAPGPAGSVEGAGGRT